MANYTQTSQIHNIKLLYLLAMAMGLFFIKDFGQMAVLFMLQLALWLYTKLPFGPLLHGLWRLKWFFLLVILSYLLIAPSESAKAIDINFGFYVLKLYPAGMQEAMIMLSRVTLLIFVSLWARLSMPPGQFVKTLQRFAIPQTVAIVIDAGLSLTADRGRGGKAGNGGGGNGSGGGRGKKRQRKKITVLFSDLRQGNFGFLDDLLDRALKKSSDFLNQRYPEMQADIRHDAAIILAVVVAVMSLKLLQLLPGLPFAPGHKNLIVIPLLVMATMTTHSKFGGLAAGFSVGIVSFLMGYGKFGVFEILHFALPGLVADLLVPVLVNGSGFLLLIRLAILGALIGLTRFAANFMILILIGSPALAWVVFIPMLVSQLVFGSLSCIVAIYIVNKYKNKNVTEPVPGDRRT